MRNEQWDYKIDGKMYGIVRIVIPLVIVVFFGMLTVDQLQAKPNKSLFVAFGFGSMTLAVLVSLVTLVIRYFCYKIYIGKSGFYFQTSPFNGAYYDYSDIVRCREELKVGRHRSEHIYHYYFHFTDKSGKTRKFLFEKPVYEHEVHQLKERIEKSAIKSGTEDF